MEFINEIYTKRFITRVKKNYPSIFFCFFLILGQFISFYLLGYINIHFVLFINAILIFCVLKKQYIFISFFIIGMFSFCIQSKKINSKLYSDNASYLVRMLSPLQNRVSNNVVFDVEVLGVKESDVKTFDKLSFKKENFLMRCSAVYLPWKNIVKANRGDILIISGKTINVEFSLNPFSYNAYLIRKNISKTCNVKFSKIIHSVTSNTFATKLNSGIKENVMTVLGDNESSGLFLSMTIGTRNLLSKTTEDKFKKVGLTHLLVVSGYQVCLIYFTIIIILKQIPRLFNKLYYYFFLQYVYKVIALAGSVFFVFVSGCDSSSIRAGIAIIILNIASTFERNNSFANSIILSFFIMHLLFPLCVLDPGVSLSYAALVGIWLGSFSKSTVKCFLMVSLYTYLTTSIVTLLWFNQISFISFILNLTIAPIISWISCNLGFLAILLNYTIDKNGYGIKLVSLILDNFKDFILKISEFSYISYVFESCPVFLISLFAIIIIFVFTKRIKYYIAFWSL